MVGVLRVSVTGALPNTEVWSVNPVFNLPVGDFPLTFTALQSIATAVNALVPSAGMKAFWNPTTTLTGCRLEHRTVDGELLAQFEAQRAVPVPGTGTNANPMQTSAVSSLRTTSTGASGRGRLYWPATGAAIDSSTLRFDATALSAFSTGIQSFLSGIMIAVDAQNDGAVLSVWSRTGASTAPVNRILYGDIADVQRRRRDTAIESYNAIAFP